MWRKPRNKGPRGPAAPLNPEALAALQAGAKGPSLAPPQRSLLGEILDWMLAPLFLLWPMSVAITYVVAQHIANVPYDQGLAHDLREEYLWLAAPALSYQVEEDANGSVRWLDRTTQPPRVLDHEPDAGWWLRTITRAMSWLPIESQL